MTPSNAPRSDAPRVAFRVDASRTIGSGHLMRSLTLAEELRRRGATATFVTRAFPDGAAAAAAARGFAVVTLPVEAGREQTWLGAGDAEEERAAGEALARLGGVDWLVVDQYALGAAWERRMRAHAHGILAIDDLADRLHDCDVLLDTTWYPADAPRRYAGLVPAGATVLEGPAYALLRPEFATAPRRVRRAVRRVLVSFGGSDLPGMTERALDALAETGLALEVDVVVGGANARREALRARSGGAVRVHVDTPAMARLMVEADLAIGAGGMTSWERLRLGLPALVVTLASNQLAVARGLASAGAAIDLGPDHRVEVGALAAAIRALHADAERLAAMSHAALRASGDGPLGTVLVADLLLRAASVGA